MDKVVRRQAWLPVTFPACTPGYWWPNDEIRKSLTTLIYGAFHCHNESSPDELSGEELLILTELFKSLTWMTGSVGVRLSTLNTAVG
jgi:hypothetical protein